MKKFASLYVKKQDLLEKQFGNHFLKKKKNKKNFADLPTLIFLGMSLETHYFFRP